MYFVNFHPFCHKHTCPLPTGVDNKAAFSKYSGNTSISQSIESIVSSNTVVRYHISGAIVWSKWRCWQLYIRCGTSFPSQYTGKQSILDHSNGCHFNFHSNREQRAKRWDQKKWTNGGREWHLYLAKPFHHFSHQHCAVGCAGEIVSQNASHKTMKSVTSRLRSVNFRHFQPDVERKTYLFAERTLPLAVIKTFFFSRYSIAFRSQFISGHEQ